MCLYVYTQADALIVFSRTQKNGTKLLKDQSSSFPVWFGEGHTGGGSESVPWCGTYNGTRDWAVRTRPVEPFSGTAPGSSLVLKLSKSSRALDLQVYSVRQRDRAPITDALWSWVFQRRPSRRWTGLIITQLSSGRCYVPSCLKAATQGVVENQCQHIKLAVNCQAEATPLTLKSSVLNAMQASPRNQAKPSGSWPRNPQVPLYEDYQKHFAGNAKQARSIVWGIYIHPLCRKSVPKACRTPFLLLLPDSKVTQVKCVQGWGGPEMHSFLCLHLCLASDETLAQEFSDFLNFDSSGRWCGWHYLLVFLKQQWKSPTDGIWEEILATFRSSC